MIVQPFLVIFGNQSFKSIFTSGIFAYYISIVPSFIPLLDILILMLFTVIINQGASQYIQMEKKTIKVMKTIPVLPRIQLLIKVSIPLLLSFTSLFITLLVLLVLKNDYVYHFHFCSFISKFIIIHL